MSAVRACVSDERRPENPDSGCDGNSAVEGGVYTKDWSNGGSSRRVCPRMFVAVFS